MTKLRFRFKDSIDEVEALSTVARGFIRPECYHLLANLKTSLEGLQATAQTSPIAWGISEQTPLRTIMSDGEYHPGGGGAHRVCAEFTSKWEIQRIASVRKRMPAKFFELVGAASTRVRLLQVLEDGGLGDQLAMWRMEIGDDSSPGCRFHVQVLGEEAALPFPHSLDVPRLPSVIATPPAVIEYVLGELFQARWASWIASESPAVNRWSVIQRERLEALLSWKLAIVRGSTGAPWPAIKRAKLSSNMFTGISD